jgi:FAD-dependent urate hydroxylase
MKSVLIIGSGIAGPAMALALQHVGIESIVYEASQTVRDNAGVFLNLAPNGLSALSILGLEDQITQLGFRNDQLIFRTDNGRVLAEAPVGGRTMMRGSVSQALHEAAIAKGVRFEFGKALQSLEASDGGVTARFADGTSTVGSALIGADGIHSCTRQNAFPNAPKPFYTGIINLGGVVQTNLPSTDTAMHMIFGRHAFFGYAVRPDGETYWFSNYAQAEEPCQIASEATNSASLRDKLLTVHRDDPAEVTQILQSLTGEIGSYPVYDIPALPEWQRGAICLIGDAAHAIGPHVGQGASLALEDAIILAKCLRDFPEPSAAFARFERLRRARVERVFTASRQTGQQKAPTGWLGRNIRNLILPLFLRRAAHATEWMYSYPLNWQALS